MKTDKRITKIADAVDFLTEVIQKNNLVVADIATDHGYIAEKVVNNPRVKKVIATDISEKCLQKIIDLIKNRQIDNIETIVGDGLIPIDKTDIAVIAGIGGYEIINMIEKQNKTNNGELKCRYFVLQPAQNEFELRKWLFKNNIYVLKDYVVEDAKRFYPIIVINVLKKQRNKSNLFNLKLGRDNDINSADFKNYLLMHKENLEFLKTIKLFRIIKDKTLFQKYRLNLLIEKLLKK